MSTRTVDIAFPRCRLAIDVRGCWWHGCPEHFRLPTANSDWWIEKIRANRLRDDQTVQRLAAEGWQTLVVWSHENAGDAVLRIVEALRQRRKPMHETREQN